MKFSLQVAVVGSSIVLLLGSCSNSKLVFKNGADWIPADFNPRTTTLLVEKLDNEPEKQAQMEAHMKTVYPYPYRFVTAGELERADSRYANTDSFRYVFIGSYGSANRHLDVPVHTSTAQIEAGTFDYHFYDRKQNKNYPFTHKANGVPFRVFRPAVNALVENAQNR